MVLKNSKKPSGNGLYPSKAPKIFDISTRCNDFI
jgi:hypothetical protein